MRKIAVIMIAFCFILLLQIPNVFAQGEISSKEINIIKTESSPTNYVVDLSWNTITTFSMDSFVIRPPPFSFPLMKILELAKKIFDNVFGQIGIGCTLLAWAILNRIKGLRHNRPKDYDGIITLAWSISDSIPSFHAR